MEKVLRTSFKEMKNNKEETPYVFFEKEHEQLRNDGEEGMRNTASSFMVVATLIGTIMFNGQPAGGFSSENSNLAVASSISSSVGLLCSSTALMKFLSILTSRYSCKDFIQSLPLRLMIGVVLLSVSIAAMMVTFCTSLALRYHEHQDIH